MRVAALLLLTVSASLAHADWLIDIPTGRKIPQDGYHIEWRSTNRTNGYTDARAGFGIGTALEATVHAQQIGGDTRVGTIDFAYTVLPPVPSISPGVSIGILDTNDQTRDRRRFFAALTFREDFDSADGTLPADVTIGGFAGERSSAFVGLGLPLSRRLRFVAEHNGIRIATGIDYQLYQKLAVRVLVRNQATTLGLSLATRF